MFRSNVVVLAVGLFVAGCGTPRANFRELDSQSLASFDSLDLTPTFGFQIGEHSYLFAQKDFEEGRQKCSYHLGFKDGIRTYSFPTERLWDLRKIYKSKATIEEKMKLSLTDIERFNREPKICDEKSKNVILSTVDTTLSIAIYAPLGVAAIVLMPHKVPQAIKKIRTEKLIKNVRFGMSSAEVSTSLSAKIELKDKGEYEIYETQKDENPFVLIFKNNRLVAFVSGYWVAGH